MGYRHITYIPLRRADHTVFYPLLEKSGTKAFCIISPDQKESLGEHIGLFVCSYSIIHTNDYTSNTISQ